MRVHARALTSVRRYRQVKLVIVGIAQQQLMPQLVVSATVHGQHERHINRIETK
jgi:hypothetical protein